MWSLFDHSLFIFILLLWTISKLAFICIVWTLVVILLLVSTQDIHSKPTRNFALAYFMKENKCFPRGFNLQVFHVFHRNLYHTVSKHYENYECCPGQSLTVSYLPQCHQSWISQLVRNSQLWHKVTRSLNRSQCICLCFCHQLII